MPLRTTRVRNRVTILLQDDGAELTLAEEDESIAQAFYEHSGNKPRKISTAFDGTAGDTAITAATNSGIYDDMVAWDNPATFLRKVEFPIVTAGEPVFILPKHMILIPEGDSLPTAIRYLESTPSTGTNNAEAYHNALHIYLRPPTSVTAVPGATAGTTTYGYRVTAVDSAGETLASVESTLTTSNATVDATNFNTLTWDRVYGADSYNIYRTTAGGTPSSTGFIAAASVSDPTATYNDIGGAASGTVPLVDTTETSLELRYLEAVARLAVCYCFEAIADKKAGFTDANFEGSDTDFGSMIDRYASRCEALRAYYDRVVKGGDEAVGAALTQKSFVPPPSDDSSYLIDAYNEDGLMR